jgi:hypothetical protein
MTDEQVGAALSRLAELCRPGEGSNCLRLTAGLRVLLCKLAAPGVTLESKIEVSDAEIDSEMRQLRDGLAPGSFPRCCPTDCRDHS